jgi:hypothetical protein
MPRRVNQGDTRLYYGVEQRRRGGVGRGRKERREGEGGDQVGEYLLGQCVVGWVIRARHDVHRHRGSKLGIKGGGGGGGGRGQLTA